MEESNPMQPLRHQRPSRKGLFFCAEGEGRPGKTNHGSIRESWRSWQLMGKSFNTKHLSYKRIFQLSHGFQTQEALPLWSQPTLPPKRTSSQHLPHSSDTSMSAVTPFQHQETVDIRLQSSNHISETKAVITDAIKNEIIVGRDDLGKLGVIPKQFPLPVYLLSEDKYTSIRESLIKDNPTVLTDELPQESLNTGCIAMKVHLTLGERKPFRISTARQIPLHWRDKAEKIIKKLIDAKVITPQDEPTEWCAPGFFVAKKNGDIRLVIDYTRLNKYVQRPIHTFP